MGMTVGELKAKLKDVDDNLLVIIETVIIENGLPVSNDELVDHIEMNDCEFYLVGARE